VADHFVSQLLREDDPVVFKRYSQAKLNMMREAIGRLDRQSNERVFGFCHRITQLTDFWNSFGTVRDESTCYWGFKGSAKHGDSGTYLSRGP